MDRIALRATMFAGAVLLLFPVWVLGQDGSTGPFVGGPVTPHVFRGDLSKLPTVPTWQEGQPVTVVGQEDEEGEPGVASAQLLRHSKSGGGAVAAPLAGDASFEGAPATGFLPPDTAADVGPNHVVEAVNTVFEIFDKQGTVLAGPSFINLLWAGAGGNCQTTNAGDPDVRYDQAADRWVIMQFTLPAHTDFCVAVSPGRPTRSPGGGSSTSSRPVGSATTTRSSPCGRTHITSAANAAFRALARTPGHSIAHACSRLARPR